MLHNILRQNAVNCVLKRRLTAVGPFSRNKSHIGISPLTFMKTKPSKESAIRDHLLDCKNIPSFEEFIILKTGNKFFLEIKVSLLIKRDIPILNKNSSAKLFLFDNS